MNLSTGARALSLLLTVCSTGLAQPNGQARGTETAEPELSKAERAEERALREFMHAGFQEAEANNWEGAARAYRSAWQIRKHFAIAMSLAEAEMRLENYLEAAELWQYYLENAPPEVKDPELDAEEELAKCRAELGSVQVTVEGDPAIVLVNDQAIGKTPLASAVWLKPGDYELKARRGAEWTQPQQVTLSAGSRVELTLEFSQTKPAEPAAPLETRASVADAAGEDSSSISSRTVVLIGGSALTIAAAAVGVAYWSKFEKLDSDAARLKAEIDQTDPLQEPGRACNAERKQAGTAHPRCDDLVSTINDQSDASRLSKIMFGAAGVLGAATVATYVLWPQEPDEVAQREPRVGVVPWMTLSGSGFQVRGTF